MLVGDTLFVGGHIGLDPSTGKPGDTPEVEARLVMEAVKMEHTIAAPEAGVVVSFHCAPGDLVSEGVDLVELQMDAAQ